MAESDPQFVTPNVTMNAYKYGLAIQVSPELEQDNAVPGALPWVVSQAVQGIRRGVGAALVTGDGSDKPNGIVNGSTTSTATRCYLSDGRQSFGRSTRRGFGLPPDRNVDV